MQKMSEAMGQQIIIDNRPSAGGIVATETVAKSEPDGYTLMLLNNTNAVSAAMFKKLPYDTVKDFAMVSTIGAFSLGVLVSPDSPVKTVKELIAQAKATPGKLNFGSINIGTTQHLSAELLKSMAGIDVTTVPFNNTAGVLTALRGNSVQVAFEFLPPVIGQVKAGGLRAIAVTSRTRFALLPDVPTLAESGVPGYEVTSWNGIAVAAKTPKAIVERLNKEIHAAVNSPQIKQRFQELGVEQNTSTPDGMRKFWSMKSPSGMRSSTRRKFQGCDHRLIQLQGRSPPLRDMPFHAGDTATLCGGFTSAVPCLLARAVSTAQLQRSLEQALVRGLAGIRGDDFIQPRRSVVLRPLPAEVAAHGRDAVCKIRPLARHGLLQVEHRGDVRQGFAPGYQRAAFHDRQVALNCHGVAFEIRRQYLVEALVNQGFALFEAVRCLMHCKRIQQDGQVLLLKRLEKLDQPVLRLGIVEDEAGVAGPVQHRGHQRLRQTFLLGVEYFQRDAVRFQQPRGVSDC